MRDLIQRTREHELWPWLLFLIGAFALTIEVALAMTYPDPVINIIGGVLFFIGLCSMTWGLCMTEIDGDRFGVPNRFERLMPGVFIDWGPYTIVRWGHAITVITLIVYAVVPFWPAALAASIGLMVIAVRRIPVVCRFFIPHYYMWVGEGRLHETNVCTND